MKKGLVRFVYPQTLSGWTGCTTIALVLSLPIYFFIAIAGTIASELPGISENSLVSKAWLCWHLLLWMRGLQGLWLLGKVSATRGETTSAIAWLMLLVVFQLFTLSIAFADWSLRL